MNHVYRTETGLERGAAHKAAGRPVAQAVVVLGAAVRPDGSSSAAMDRRVRAGVALAAGLTDATLVLSGGFGKGHGPSLPTEARVMADLARAAGLPADVPLWLEEHSRNTLENAAAVSVLLTAVAPARLIVVTDEAHLPRALTCFRAARRIVGTGWTLDGHGVRIAEGRALARARAREALARLLYRARLLRGGMLAAVRAARHHASPSPTECA